MGEKREKMVKKLLDAIKNEDLKRFCSYALDENKSYISVFKLKGVSSKVKEEDNVAYLGTYQRIDIMKDSIEEIKSYEDGDEAVYLKENPIMTPQNQVTFYVTKDRKYGMKFQHFASEDDYKDEELTARDVFAASNIFCLRRMHENKKSKALKEEQTQNDKQIQNLVSVILDVRERRRT